MEEYRNCADGQHAPGELIERTILRIREEERAGNRNWRRKKPMRTLKIVTAFAACAAVCLIIFAETSQRSGWIYHEVTDVSYRDGSTEQYSEEWTLQEYEEYLGQEFIGLPEEFQISNIKIYVKYDEERIHILADEAAFYLEVYGCAVVIKASKSGLEVPKELLEGEGNDINGTIVYTGENIAGQQLLAFFYYGDTEYFVICSDMSRKEFEKMLKLMF